MATTISKPSKESCPRSYKPRPLCLPSYSTLPRKGSAGNLGKEVAFMRHRLLVLSVALIMASMMGIATGPAWGQNQTGCDGHEGDHGRGCLITTKEKCKQDAWEVFNIFGYLFENVGVCN
jgi:hypothetical protein